MPIHVGGLVDIINNNPTYATGVGLVLYGLRGQEGVTARPRDGKMISKMKHRMSGWLSEFF
jgi:cell division ATPase FtsA